MSEHNSKHLPISGSRLDDNSDLTDYIGLGFNCAENKSGGGEKLDAHLTSLSAIPVIGSPARQDLLLDVAATITQFYPRIASVNAIQLDTSESTIQTPRGLASEDAALRHRPAAGVALCIRTSRCGFGSSWWARFHVCHRDGTHDMIPAASGQQ